MRRRLVLLSLSIAGLAPFLHSQSLHGYSVDQISRFSGSRVVFSGVDMRPLEARIAHRLPQLCPREVKRVARHAFHFVFSNRLNRSHFLVEPSPAQVMRGILSILDLNDELGRAIERALARLWEDPEAGSSPRVIHSLDRLVQGLRRAFDRFFVESHTSSVRFTLPQLESRSAQFRYYLNLCARFHRQLTRRLQRYFLNARPQLVQVSEYRECTVRVLSDSLLKAGALTRRRLDR